MASAEKFDCEAIRRDLETLLSSLTKMKVIQGRPPASFNWVRKCLTCTKKTGGNCTGAEIRIDQNSPLSFIPCQVREGAYLLADICGLSKRSGQGRHQVTEHSVLVRVWEVEGLDATPGSANSAARVIHRVRVEMAKGSATEPFAHLQLGGRLATADEHWDLPDASGYPRWPAPLVDLALASELVLYTFFPEKWKLFCSEAETLAVISHSEQLYMSLLFDTWNNHLSSRIQDPRYKSAVPTFLAAVCNSRPHPWKPPVTAK